MSKKTRQKRLNKEIKRTPATYVSPVKDKPRERAWKLYKTEGIRYKD